MISVIYTKDKTHHCNKKKDLDIKEIADRTDISVITVKVLILRAEDYISVINISVEGSSVIFSLSTLLKGSIFYFF